jgi:hypothetical protein
LFPRKSIRIWRHCDVMSVICFLYFYFGWSGAYFICMLYNCSVPTYHRFLRQRLLFKWCFNSICLLFILITLENIFWCTTTKVINFFENVEISRAKFHEIQKTNDVHDVTRWRFDVWEAIFVVKNDGMSTRNSYIT